MSLCHVGYMLTNALRHYRGEGRIVFKVGEIYNLEPSHAIGLNLVAYEKFIEAFYGATGDILVKMSIGGPFKKIPDSTGIVGSMYEILNTFQVRDVIIAVVERVAHEACLKMERGMLLRLIGGEGRGGMSTALNGAFIPNSLTCMTYAVSDTLLCKEAADIHTRAKLGINAALSSKLITREEVEKIFEQEFKKFLDLNK
jgi:hypothetical protein